MTHDTVRILLIDDNPDDRRLAIREIERELTHVSIHEVSAPGSFEDALRKPAFDVVVTDYQLRWSNGLEVLRAIKRHHPQCPVVMFTGTGSEEIAVEAMKEGLSDYILKSAARYRRLAFAVQRVLEQARDRQRSEHAEARFQELFDEVPVGIFRATRSTGRILDANRAFVELLGYPDRNTLLQSEGSVLWEVDPDEKAQWRELTRRYGVVRDFEGRARRYDGEIIWTRSTTRPIRDESGEVEAYEGIMEDITDRKRTEEALRHSEEEVRQLQKMEALGRLAGGVAHDFNNLLTMMTVHSHLLLQSADLESSQRELTEEILKAAERSAALVRQLLAFSRRDVVSPESLDLNEVVQDVGKMLRRLIGEDIELRTELDPSLARVLADRGRIEQVLMNLAVNARDAMSQGGRLTIRTATVDEMPRSPLVPGEIPQGRCVRLSMSDTGRGMDVDTLERVFEPFFTTKERGVGTGLGLSTVYGIVQQNQGHIDVESEPGVGTTFHIYLPEHSDEAAASKTSSDATRSVNGSARGGSEAVLLVEDAKPLREVAHRLLEQNGYRVLVASDGDEALRECLRGPIDLLVTDVVMPRMSGRELADRVTRLHPDTKVLYMSGYTDETITRHGIEDSRVFFLEKPFLPDVLARKVREVLDAS